MHRVFTAVCAATLTSACSVAHSPSAAPGEPSGAHRHAHPGAPAHPGGHAHGEGHHAFSDAEAWAKVFDDPTRDEWQRPDQVVAALDLSPGMTVADVGAGTGYFAVRLARAVAPGEVLATDIEPDMVKYLSERAAREQLPNVRAIHVEPGSTGLPSGGVDRVLVVHVWHHLSDRVIFARELANTLRPGGKIGIVEFSLTAHRGPPAHMRLAPDALIAELEQAGLKAQLLPLELPDQYMVLAAVR